MLRFLLTFVLLFNISADAYCMENAFYMLHNRKPTDFSQTAYSRLENNYKKINLIISQAYQVDSKGNVSGFVNADLMSFAKEHHMHVMAMVTNADFDQAKFHRFLLNSEAQKHAITSLQQLVKQNQYYGVQFDFEDISFKDRSLLTKFYTLAIKAMHNTGAKVSVAVVPITISAPPESAFEKRKFENWSGAYDLGALGRLADFVTIMTYDQHTEGTTPGPNAAYPWVISAVEYTLHFIPANKVSLGIPTYSNYWYTGTSSGSYTGRIFVNMDELSYREVESILNKNHVQLQWNATDKVNYAIFVHHWLNDYLYVEDAQSFAAKLSIVKKYHLRGISVFDIGNEDPSIWNLL